MVIFSKHSKNPKNSQKSQIFQCHSVVKFWNFVSQHQKKSENFTKTPKNPKNFVKILKIPQKS
jgi:hypothetical protein